MLRKNKVSLVQDNPHQAWARKAVKEGSKAAYINKKGTNQGNI